MWAQDGRLKEHAKLAGILFSWRNWTSEQEAKSFVTGIIQEDLGLMNFLVGFLSKSMSYGMSDYVAKEHWRISIKNIEVFTDVQAITPRVRNLLTSDTFSQLSDKQKLAVKTFLDEVDGKFRDFP